jgi:hypothetical protein
VEEMSIGDFARRSRLSPKALRLYDGLGLLSPSRVDELSGYRCYEGAQRPGGRRVLHLPGQLADEALRNRADAQGIHPQRQQLSLTPEDPGVRITYLARPPVTETTAPGCDLAVPFA